MADKISKLALTSCEYCGIGRLCLSNNLLGGDLQELKPVVERRFPIAKKQRLFTAQTKQQAIYVVKSGSLKTCEVDIDGDEQILDFYLPGDVLGLEDLSRGKHCADAIALEDSWLCSVPAPRLSPDSMEGSLIFREMFSVVCHKLARQQEMIHQLGKAEATERLASFLLDLSRRLKDRGLNGGEFRLSMDRADIASYLRTTLETVSRAFSNLQRQGCIKVSGKSVRIVELDQLIEHAQKGSLAV
ncbi:MAG: helix-turn-helix domain-containing protein [Xanthomonadales bacterium]|nr:helix-turn-helix domain-containing protein [Xanthomonadales bacterium]